MKKYIFSIILIGCGTQQPETKEKFIETQSPVIPQEVAEKEKTALPPMAMTVSGEKPTCGAENENQLIYHVDDGLFYSCKGNDWAVIDLKGKDGEKGKDGVDGSDGQLIIDSWFSSKNEKFCMVGDEKSATSYCVNQASLVLYSNEYVQLSMGGPEFSFSVTNKIKDKKVVFFARINESVLTKFTITFSDDMKEVHDFLWQSALNGTVINATYRGMLFNDDLFTPVAESLPFPSTP